MIGAALLALLLAQAPLVFETASEVVLLDAFVSRNGQPVTGLSAGDFEVTEDGRACEVELVGDVPLAAVLMFDASRSLTGAKLGHLQKASDTLVSGLGPKDQAMLMTFTHGLHLRAPLTGDRDAIRKALAGLVAGGRSSVHDALFASLLLAPRLPGRPVVIVFSDGEDTSSWLGPQVPLQLARESDALVFAVGAGARSLTGLAAITGGRTIAAEGSDLQAAFASVLDELRTRYLLRVTPQSSDPGYHEVQVRLRRGVAEVRARPGYWRPGKKGR